MPRGAPQSPLPMVHKGAEADAAVAAALLERRRRAAQEGGAGGAPPPPLPAALANPPGAAYLELYGHRVRVRDANPAARMINSYGNYLERPGSAGGCSGAGVFFKQGGSVCDPKKQVSKALLARMHLKCKEIQYYWEHRARYFFDRGAVPAALGPEWTKEGPKEEA